MYEIIVMYSPPDGEPQKHLVNRYEYKDVYGLHESLKQLRLLADKVVAHDERVIKIRKPPVMDLAQADCGHARIGYIEAGDPYDTDKGHTGVTVCDQDECITRAMERCATRLPGQVPRFVRDI